METVEVVIRLPQNLYFDVKNGHASNIQRERVIELIKNGTVLPKGHGKIVDLGKIDEDRIEKDNPIIYLTINGEYIEAVSLDYLNGLQAIIEADKEVSEWKA